MCFVTLFTPFFLIIDKESSQIDEDLNSLSSMYTFDPNMQTGYGDENSMESFPGYSDESISLKEALDRWSKTGQLSSELADVLSICRGSLIAELSVLSFKARRCRYFTNHSRGRFGS